MQEGDNNMMYRLTLLALLVCGISFTIIDLVQLFTDDAILIEKVGPGIAGVKDVEYFYIGPLLICSFMVMKWLSNKFGSDSGYKESKISDKDNLDLWRKK